MEEHRLLVQNFTDDILGDAYDLRPLHELMLAPGALHTNVSLPSVVSSLPAGGRQTATSAAR